MYCFLTGNYILEYLSNICQIYFGEYPLRKKTIKNYGKYSPMLKWRTIEGTIGINRQKLLKCSNYSPMLNYMCRRGRAYLKQEFLLNSIKNIQKKPVET